MSNLCLVTGGAGFIGSHLVSQLVADGRPVRVLDNFSTGLSSNLAHLKPAPEIVEGTLTDPDTVHQAAHDVDVIFHLGAIASVQRGIEAPEEMHAVCATGSINVLNAARKQNVRRVVYAGSASAYGIPAGDVQSEDDPLCPLSAYAAAKLAGEHYCQSFAQTYDLETVRLRFFNVFGPNQRADSPYSGVIAIFANLMKAGRTPTIHGDGLQSRDFVYVTDVVQALLLASTAENVSGKVFNVGTGKRTSVLDLVNVINSVNGTDIKPNHGDGRIGDVRHSCADIARASRELGYKPQVTFDQGLAETLRWYQESE